MEFITAHPDFLNEIHSARNALRMLRRDVILCGPSGSGKSFLLEQLCRDISQSVAIFRWDCRRPLNLQLLKRMARQYRQGILVLDHLPCNKSWLRRMTALMRKSQERPVVLAALDQQDEKSIEKMWKSAAQVRIPPLVQRRLDVEKLLTRLLPAQVILSAEARLAALRHDWPGELVELKFCAQFLATHSQQITPKQLEEARHLFLGRNSADTLERIIGGSVLPALAKRHGLPYLRKMLEMAVIRHFGRVHNGRIRAWARDLKIPPSTLIGKRAYVLRSEAST